MKNNNNWNLLRNHIRQNICAGNEEKFDYVLRWMASGIQNPTKNPGIALVLRGTGGASKDVFVSNYGALFGPGFLQIPSLAQLPENFSSYFLLSIGDAFSGKDRANDSLLKALITEPTIVFCDGEGGEPRAVDNSLHIILSLDGNRSVPSGSGSRRFYALDVTEIQDEAYFTAIQEQMDNGGAEAMRHELQGMSL